MKVRAVVNGVSFYTNSAQIIRGVGDFSGVNIAVRQVYDRMLAENVAGLATTIHLYDYKMTKQSFDVQLSRTGI